MTRIEALYYVQTPITHSHGLCYSLDCQRHEQPFHDVLYSTGNERHRDDRAIYYVQRRSPTQPTVLKA
ncbi:hypothetical protein J7295_02854 [Nakaseomyces glabratus]|nr:hypothetical protein J7295_02854 [Nakaseomyces glabratus]